MSQGRIENTADTTLLLNIGDMIDLAIGTPEVGVVDFNMLQSVLHVLAQQMRVLGTSVELRGSAAQLPATRDNVQTVAITEYIVATDETEEQEKKMVKVPQTSVGVNPEGTLLVVERVKKVESAVGGGPTHGRHSVDGSTGQLVQTAPGITAPTISHTAGGTEKVSLVTISKFNLLEHTVKDLKSRVYGSIPKNEQILEEVRSQSNLRSITDMWTSLNVSSRLEAAEAGLAKLSSLVQDLIGESAALQLGDKKLPKSGGVSPARTPRPASGGQPPTADDITGVNAILQSLRTDLDELTDNFYAALEEQGIEIGPTGPVAVLYATATGPSGGGYETAGGQYDSPGDQLTTPGSVTPGMAQHGTQATGGKATATAAVATGGGPKRAGDKPRRSFSTGGVNARLNQLEERLVECCEARIKSEDIVNDQLSSFQDQLEGVTKQIANATCDTPAGVVSGDFLKNVEGLTKIVETVQEMQEQLKDVHKTASKLAAEKEERQHHINALLEQIELLKTIKLDREDMVEAMAEKADLRLLARKVSHDQFETACDDLSRGVERALGKLNVQESLWQQALDDIQREIETKLDKMELSPVKDFFNNKLRQLQDNLKQMADLRREVEAAGTKRRLLRDVNCISCDAKTVMAMDAGAMLPVSKPLPPTLSMKPYLSYELDAIRKQQASNVAQRNMHDWEHIDKQMQVPKALSKVRTDSDKHICNRYCGGSHTVTTASQRVVRLGHFLRQWGPEVLPLSSGLAAGDDGKMYKVAAIDGTSMGPGGAVDNMPCTPRSPHKKGDVSARLPSPPAKPECRCLEPGENTKV